MVEIIENFPSQIKAIASRLSLCNEGPFLPVHNDFLHGNIILDENDFDIREVLTRKEHAPFPESSSHPPISLQPYQYPSIYLRNIISIGSCRQLLDDKILEVYYKRGDYIEMVRSLEHTDSGMIYPDMRLFTHWCLRPWAWQIGGRSATIHRHSVINSPVSTCKEDP
jgi:hypothetical protein